MSATVAGLAQLLADAEVGEYDPDSVLPGVLPPIEIGTMSPKGKKAITVTTYPGGPAPDSRNGTEYPRAQVRVRGGFRRRCWSMR